MENSKKISVLVPTFNRGIRLTDAINAILNQGYGNFEIIIKDGADNAIPFIPKDKRIIYIGGKDRGITDAINQAIDASTGDIFVWANDDDRISEDTFQFVIDNMGDSKWCYGKILMINEDTGGKNEFGGEWDFNRLLSGNFIPQPSVYWTREAYNEVGKMSEEQDLVSDYEYWLRLGKRWTPKFFNRIMAYYTIHKEQITSRIPQEQLRQAKIVSQKYL